MSVRVRFAPSPTGHMHVGNARTALFNYLFARSTGGTFILRIEDTDLERSTKESEQLIYEDMHWLGLSYDEGGTAGGDFGPYRQTERFHLYEKAVNQLMEEGHAYYCFCSKDELDKAREDALKNSRPPLYNGKCSCLSKEEAEKRIAAGEKPAIRFRVSKPEVVVKDLIHGDVSFPTSSFGDFIIVRPDKVPVYNFAVVVDDYSMEITHVIRGDDHLPNTPKQILIYDALGKKVPLFAHIPMILGPDRSKLSKRHGNTSIEQFREAGYLPDALVNFMTLLSWSDGEGKEIFSMQEVITKFSLDRVSSSPAVFDFDKLKWMNGMYIRAAEISLITELCIPYLVSAGYIDANYYGSDKERMQRIVDSVRDNLEILSDIVRYTSVYFKDMPEFDDEAKEILTLDTTKSVINCFADKIDGLNTITEEEYKQAVKSVQKETGAKGKALYMALRVGMTGCTKGPELDRFVTLMPAGELVKRLRQTSAGL